LLEPKRGIYKRLILGMFLIVLASSAATAGALFDEVNALVGAFKRGNTLKLDDELAQADPGKPQTILLLGSDTRAKGARDYEGAKARGRSDTMMLVRLDPDQPQIPVLSLPRDLKVQIPGHGVDKLNAAYAFGGVKLTLRTIKQFTGLRVNHVVNVDFRGFRKAINALGCVYVDVDRRYFNNNSSGERYATIDINPGYQKLCDQDALDYVRYRHTDNDLIRAARQQDFLRQMKAQIGLNKIIRDRKELIKIFGKYTQSDIGSRKTVLRLVKLIALSASHPIHQIHFTADSLGDKNGFVTASSEETHRLADEFLGAVSPADQASARKKKKRSKRAGPVRLVDSSGTGKDQALQLVNQHAKGLDIYYPRQLTPGAQFIAPPRYYTLRGKRRRKFRAYRMVIGYGDIGEYYGLQGTTWTRPPILNGPSEDRKVGGRKVRIFYDGQRVRLVSWKAHGAVYWISNTLSQKLNLQQMLAVVRATKPL
jgi:polyisoprenyl-teichoic acid--peptidoglycan teichoic acid transferase